jgi:hypothetical protein
LIQSAAMAKLRNTSDIAKNVPDDPPSCELRVARGLPRAPKYNLCNGRVRALVFP